MVRERISQAQAGNTSKACDHHGMPVNEIDFEREDLKNPGKTATEARLELEWVHGYRGSDCRNNVYYVPRREPSGDVEKTDTFNEGTNLSEALYFTAAVGVKIQLDSGSLKPKLRNQNKILLFITLMIFCRWPYMMVIMRDLV